MIDHLGQSPFHLLMRPCIGQDTLRKIVTQMVDLPIYRHISTARDCFVYTIAGQLNFHGPDFVIILGPRDLVSPVRPKMPSRTQMVFKIEEIEVGGRSHIAVMNGPPVITRTIHLLRLSTTSSCMDSLLITEVYSYSQGFALVRRLQGKEWHLPPCRSISRYPRNASSFNPSKLARVVAG
jgi:hypothetical protein